MAGSISLSLSQQLDSLGRVLSGGLLYTYAAGTTTPQSAYQDTGLVSALPNPITLDAAGRVPQLFFADGNIKVRLTDANGVVQLAADNILVIGSSAGGGGGATVDPTTVLQTGWIQPIYGTGNVTGFVRANRRTIGNGSSGASERANADTAALFAFLYAADVNLVVAPGGRGVSAAADFAANKTIELPDCRGRAIAGLDDMGNSAAGRLTSTYFGTAATVLGAAGGDEKQTLALSQLPTGITARNALQAITINSSVGNLAQTTGGVGTGASNPGGGNVLPVTSGSWSGASSLTTNNDITVTSNNTSGSAHPIASPMMLATIYIKL